MVPPQLSPVSFRFEPHHRRLGLSCILLIQTPRCLVLERTADYRHGGNCTATIDAGLFTVLDRIVTFGRYAHIIGAYITHTVCIARRPFTCAGVTNVSTAINGCFGTILNAVDAGGGCAHFIGAAADTVSVGQTCVVSTRVTQCATTIERLSPFSRHQHTLGLGKCCRCTHR